jgi:hypothetical protein
MVRKRKVTYPVARTSRRPAPSDGEAPVQRPSVAAINLSAGVGRAGLTVGSRVLITGPGLYTGETAVVESEPSGVIPSAIVRTAAGRTRRVRTIDLQPIIDEG